MYDSHGLVVTMEAMMIKRANTAIVQYQLIFMT